MSGKAPVLCGYQQRPARNGGAGTTLEILIALTLLAAGTLTLLALRNRHTPRDSNDDDEGNDRS